MYKYLIIFLLIPFTLFAFSHSEDEEADKESDVLFSGTLLSFSENVYDVGRVSIQPYLLDLRTTGIYDTHSHFKKVQSHHEYIFLCTFQAGIFERLDAQITIQNVYTHSPNGSFFNIGDTLFFMGFQILNGDQGWNPFDVRILLGEVFPTGNFTNLDVDLLGGDITGLGAYQTAFVLAIGKTFLEKCRHPLNLNYNISYTLPSSVNVDNLSIFGGGPGTIGRVKPGDIFITNLAFQLSLSRHFAFDMDFNYEHVNRSIFYPTKGITGPFAGLPSSELFSITAGIQYNINEDFGISAGTWQTIYGRNTIAFSTYYFTFYYFF